MNGAPGAERPDFTESGNGGMGPGQQPWGQGNDVPHFDKEGHFRTHESIEAVRRRQAQRQRGVAVKGERVARGSGFWTQFMVMFSLLSLGIWLPGVVGIFGPGNV